MKKLAILGGAPVIESAFPSYNSIGDDEIKAVVEVLRSGSLSAFYGSEGDSYWGGARVREFEQAWSERFRAKHAVSVNSATSGLYAALGAINLGPGDEVIVPPYTMSATVITPLFFGAIPRFADIEEETFCINPYAVREVINTRTRAILAVNLFGHPAKLHELRRIAEENGLYLIEDNAQAPLAEEFDKLSGTIGHIGVFSLNFHKHIHTGEGGICVTQDDDLALRMKLIRNHAENVVEAFGIKDLTNMIGHNLRMTEMQAAIGIEQLKRIETHVAERACVAERLSEVISDLPGLTPPKLRSGCRHVYYVWGLRFNEDILGVSRTIFCKALMAEGVPVFEGYVKPLYLLPVFQKKIAIGSGGFPFSLSPELLYNKGMCPVSERMHEKEFIGFECCAYSLHENDIDLVLEAFEKVYSQRADLTGL